MCSEFLPELYLAAWDYSNKLKAGTGQKKKKKKKLMLHQKINLYL
jgi:hypothetical protein